MATLVLSAVGASVGGAIGGSVLGLSSVVLGRAAGATFGRLIDQRILGQGSDAVPTGRIDRFHLTSAGEGEAIAKSFGRVRIGGQVIWASRFREDIVKSGRAGKGGGGSAKKTYGYSVSLALALGEGAVSRIGRVWADGNLVAKDDYNIRFYPGDEDQLPDPKIEAVEGAGMAPAFRGVAYVVFEDLDLAPFGNRVPQFSFEVFRSAQPAAGSGDPAARIRGVALIPGTGEYALATTPVHFDLGLGVNRSANVNSANGKTDFVVSIDEMRAAVPNCGAVSLVVSWFGDDLRCGTCTVRPKVEQTDFDGVGMSWSVSGVPRMAATQVSEIAQRPVFGGTQADASVLEAIAHLTAEGQEVMLYPFMLMDVQAGNGLHDPWSGGVDQAVMPWRGRITLGDAPGQAGSTDQSTAAEAEVAAFFGNAAVADFSATNAGVDYTGPAEWSYRRFILHYAHLCAQAGGVSSFCIGSEMRGLTQIRGANGSFPAVEALIQLAADVRTILGSGTRIGYAADWSEYFGYHPQDGSGDVLFHLDALWADANIDFIGIDNYMPLSDWRDGADHADAGHGSVYALEYLKGNVAGGEGFDWYYANETARQHQIRTPIADGAHGEDWVFRYKDIRAWWSNEHFERIGGVRQAAATGWIPQSKPIWFTEYGCAAIDKGTNQPNAFVDEKSSESREPHFSNGIRDDLIQTQYLRATQEFWGNGTNNPVSGVYAAPMVDMAHAHVWAWDARPWPDFPGNLDLWSDGVNYARGHWISGRLGAQSLGDIVAETCEANGVTAYDVSALYGSVTGYLIKDTETGRGALQPLLTTYAIDAVEENGVLAFRNRASARVVSVAADQLVWTGEESGDLVSIRQPDAETAGQVRVRYIEADGTYEAGATEAVFAQEPALTVSQSEIPVVLSQSESRGVAERWLAESRIARETAAFALPPSLMEIGAGDVVALPEGSGGGLYRIDRLEDVGALRAEAVRIEKAVYLPSRNPDSGGSVSDFVAPVPVYPLFLDLPLIRGSEIEHAPHVAVTATPWPGSVALFASPTDDGYVLNRLIESSAVIGVTETPLWSAMPGRWDNGAGFRVKMFGGALASASAQNVLNGANILAIGSGNDDVWEVVQFSDTNLVAADTYELRVLLRGQAGTEALIPASWPVGSQVVVLDGHLPQVELAMSARDLARHYRIGPAARPYSDISYVHEIRAFSGVGLRPYAPGHLRSVKQSNGDRTFDWVRRTRIDGDRWGAGDVPLGEAFEAYRVRVIEAGAIVRETDVAAPGWTYAGTQKAADGTGAAYAVEVAQISERFGAGLFARIDINE